MFSKQVHLIVMVMANLWWSLPASTGKEACSCYTFHGDLRPWFQSRQHCLDNGGDLVSLETIEEWSRMNDEIQHRTTDKLGHNEWHIGLTNLTGVWRWMNNKTLTYDRWQEGEPEYVTNKPFVTMARNWPIGTQGLFNSLRGDIPRARICEYEKSCASIKETCRKLSASFAVYDYTTPKPVRPSTASFPTYMTEQRTTRHQKTNPVFKGKNPTSKPNSKKKQKTPFYVVVVVIILGVLIFGCCCVVIVAFRWRKRRKTEKISKEEDQLNEQAAIKTPDSPDNSSDSEDFDDPQQKPGERNMANISNELNVATNGTNLEHRTTPLRHEYAEILIIREDDDGDDCNGRGSSKENKVRFASDENEKLRNECTQNGKRNHATKDDCNSIGSYSVKPCKKHYGNGKSGKLKASPRSTVDQRKPKGLLKTNRNNDFETMETEQENQEMDIVKLDIVMPTKEAQYASIVEIYPQENDAIINRNDKKPFLKTFAPVNGYHLQNGRNFDNEQNGRDFEEYEQNGRDFEEYEQNGGDSEEYEQNETNFEENDGDDEYHYEKNGRIYDEYEQNGRNCKQHGRQFDERDLNMYPSVDSKLVNNSNTDPYEPVYAVVDKSKKTNKKGPFPNVRMNYVELAEFDKNEVLYTKTMPPLYQHARYTEVEIPNEWD